MLRWPAPVARRSADENNLAPPCSASAGAIAAALTVGKSVAQAARGASVANVNALIFDVFGTVVDWRNGVARDAERILKPLGYNLDWLAFADAWRALYEPTKEEVRSGREPFVKLDVLHRRMLDRVRPQFGLEKLDDKTADDLNLAWHRLDAWPDVATGFARLSRKFMLAPCSNGNIALMVALKRRNNLPWDAILGAEIARDFKPKPRAYLASVEALNLTPPEVMMVAAHSEDLRQAATNGLLHGPRRPAWGIGTGHRRKRAPRARRCRRAGLQRLRRQARRLARSARALDLLRAALGLVHAKHDEVGELAHLERAERILLEAQIRIRARVRDQRLLTPFTDAVPFAKPS